jgi:hypothetical protein
VADEQLGGRTSHLAGGIVRSRVALLSFTAVGALIFGYLYYRTNNLWTPLLAHLIDNSVWLFVHIETATRSNAETDVAFFGRIGFLSLVLIAWFVAKLSGIPPLEPWRTKDTSEHFAHADGGSR